MLFHMLIMPKLTRLTGPAEGGARVPAEEAGRPAYVSKIRLERLKGSLRRAYLPVEKEPVWFGVHDEVAEHYKATPGAYEPHATTLDYVVAAAAG
jgi:hypothetical protein